MLPEEVSQTTSHRDAKIYCHNNNFIELDHVPLNQMLASVSFPLPPLPPAQPLLLDPPPASSARRRCGGHPRERI